MNEEKFEGEGEHRRVRKILVAVFIIIFALIIGVAATGIYSFPFISSIFPYSQPKDLGIKSSEEALASLKEKIPLTIAGDEIGTLGNIEAFDGQMAVEASTTSEEITSWLNRHESRESIFTDTQVKKIEGGLEISTRLNKYVKAPVYIKVMINQIGTNQIQLDILKAKIGIFNIPETYKEQTEDWFENKINQRLSDTPGFRMDEYEIHNGYSSFKGTFPEVVRPTPAGWSDFLMY